MTSNQDLKDLLREAVDRLETQQGQRVDPLACRIRVALGDVDPASAFAYGFARAWRPLLAERRREIEQHIERGNRHLASCNALLASMADNDPDRAMFEDVSDEKAQLAASLRERNRVDEVINSLADDPTHLLLPLGTIVRVPAITGAIYGSPVAGAVGIVVGYRLFKHHSPISVAFGDDVAVDGKGGGHYRFDKERPTAFYYNADELEVVGPARLYGGQPNSEIGYKPTHHRPRDTYHDSEMILEGVGRLWRVQLINGMPEVLGAADRIEEYPWLLGHEIERSAAAPAPSAGAL